jgi:hypothetical protein
MAWSNELPADLVDFVRTRVFGEFATVSGAGVPIDTPTFVFPNADVTTLDIGTGLAYPAKAERARRNPKVGLLLEGGPDEPVVSVAGMAAVRDADLQANLDRYTAETIFSPNINPDLIPWETTREKKVYYLTRMLVCVAPAHIRWWPARRAMDQAPNEWLAPPGTVFPASDPAPGGKASDSPNWPQEPWQALRETALGSGLPGHLTLLDEAGFPLPIRMREVQAHAEGFQVVAPASAPWSPGKATLSFAGKEVFVGDVRREGEALILVVERALPVLPTVADPSRPSADTFSAFMKRMEFELARRGVERPMIPLTPPEPTEGAKIRQRGLEALSGSLVGGGLYTKD